LDYRGELFIKLVRDYIPDSGGLLETGLLISKGDRIAQGIILPIPNVSFIEDQELSQTERGEAGLGSTGA